MALYDLNNKMVTLLNESTNLYNFKNNYYTLNSTIKAGKYRLKVVEKRGDAYIPIKTAQNVDDTSIIELLDGVKSHNLNLLNDKDITANIRKAKPKDYLQVEFSFGNNLCKPFNGMIALALTNEKDKLIYIVGKDSINNLKEGYYFKSYMISDYIPDDAASGEYRIRIFARENEGQEWQLLEGATVNYLPLTIENGKLGIEELKNEANEIVIYPNPVKNILYIKSDSEQQIKSISIFDFSGKEVLQGNIYPSNGVNVSSLISGAYIIKIQTSKEIMKYKFIKK